MVFSRLSTNEKASNQFYYITKNCCLLNPKLEF